MIVILFPDKNLASKTLFTKHPICGTSTGFHLCCKKSRESDLKKYGSGITLYFQFLKHMTAVFFIMSLLSIPAYIFYLSGNAVGKELDPKNIKNALTAISLGNIGQSGFACDFK